MPKVHHAEQQLTHLRLASRCQIPSIALQGVELVEPFANGEALLGSTAPGSSMLACSRSAASLAVCTCCASMSGAHADAIKPFTTSLGRLAP